jgi:hypothetical protein
MTNDQYIEHEVKLRVHDVKFKIMESKLNWLISLVVGGWIFPVVLHYLKLV